MCDAVVPLTEIITRLQTWVDCILREMQLSGGGELQTVGRVLALIPKLDREKMEKERTTPGRRLLLKTLEVFTKSVSAVVLYKMTRGA